MTHISISQTAKLLNVSTRTLMRWDKEGKFPAMREQVSNNRYYDLGDVQDHAKWFELRREHRLHLDKLDAIRKEANKFAATQPLQSIRIPKFHKLEDMKKAYDNLHEWEQEHRRILAKYANIRPGFKAKLDQYS